MVYETCTTIHVVDQVCFLGIKIRLITSGIPQWGNGHYREETSLEFCNIKIQLETPGMVNSLIIPLCSSVYSWHLHILLAWQWNPTSLA